MFAGGAEVGGDTFSHAVGELAQGEVTLERAGVAAHFPSCVPSGVFTAVGIGALEQGLVGAIEVSGVAVIGRYLGQGVETHQVREVTVGRLGGEGSFPFALFAVDNVDAVVHAVDI